MAAGYTIRDAARLANLPEHRVRAYVRAGLVAAGPDSATTPQARDKRPRLMFQDLLILRLARALIADGLSAHEVERALGRLKAQLPAGQPLSALQLRAESGRVVVDDGQRLWEPVTGQGYLRLGASGPAATEARAPSAKPAPVTLARPVSPESATQTSYVAEAAHWFESAIALEEEAPQRAYEAYLHALEVNPEHAEAMINVGRLCAAAREVDRAAAYFRQALRIDPANPVAHFNLGVTFHDQGDLPQARAAYEAALAADPNFVDAHFNLAALLEQLGERDAALDHLRAYRASVEGDPP